MSLVPGQSLGPYTILAPLGAGGMGEVYRARDARLDREVAIKVVPPSVANSPDALARFERESRAIAALSHPNILTIFDVGTSNGHPYAVMELLEGETLRARVANGPLPVRKAVEIAAQIARGLAAAHDRQIAHRDLKPDNVFLTPTGGVKILDFGLARDTSAQSELTRLESPTIAPATTPGTVLGTVGYMSPEQVRGEPADQRSDLFSLGCVLYEMLTGQRAYRRETAAETMSAILREDPPDPSTLNVTVPPGVLRALRRCLEKRPQERFESARDLAFALESAVDSNSTSAATALPPVRSRRWLLSAVGAAAVGAVLGAVGMRVLGGPSTGTDASRALARLHPGHQQWSATTLHPRRGDGQRADWWTLPISPDGSRVVVKDDRGAPVIYPVAGGAPLPIPNLNPDDVVVQWSSDGRGLLVAHRDGLPWVIQRVALDSGRRTPAVTIRPHDAAGLRLSVFAISRNAKYYVHTYARLMSELYVVEGLK